MDNICMETEDARYSHLEPLLFEDPVDEIAAIESQHPTHHNDHNQPQPENFEINKISDTTLQEYRSLLSWLREVFETKLRLKLKKLTEFAACVLCQKPINDVFDMVFVEQYHLICLLGQRYEQVLGAETTSDIQLFKINLFHSFKTSSNQRTLIETCPLLQRFLGYLKSEITTDPSISSVPEGLQNIAGNTKSTARVIRLFKCRFCDESFDQEYLVLRHEISHPEVITGKKCFLSIRKDKQMCPYCRKKYDQLENIRNHEDAHERALKFHWTNLRPRTYQCHTLRARRRERLKCEPDCEPSFSVRSYTNRKKLIAREPERVG
ncbi:uncharacterized protein LOC129732007 [Wyeomyia smithii]|uniref:uncharacterized protein LOC129732007 n=1 Tax=Wyeomyia smithii TaxID=174621 RepID=UPI002467D8C8|nr:uncharacterized protein LOC129732007 [Wyeomyia smithii]